MARDAADAVHALTPDASGRPIASTYTGRQPSSVVWLFSGSGYYAGMGAGLAACEPAYRHALDDALSTLDPDLEAAVRGLVCQPPAASGNRPAEGPARTLPALVAVQYAIGCQLQTWGIPPSGMMGEGVGEYTAACFAGVFDIGQAMALAAFEGRLLEGSASGTGEGPVQAPPADAAIEDPRFGELERFCRAMPFKAPARPLISNATGAWITSVEAADPAFWARRPRSSRGAEGIQTLLTLRDAVFVEIGPGAFAMSPPAQSSSAPAVVACTIRPPDKPDSDVAFLLNAVGRLWAAGVPVEASKLFPGEQRRRVGLGTYPFERQRRWSDPGSQAPSPAAAGPTARPDMADWFLWPAWERSIPPPASALPSSWLVLTDDSPLAADIVAGLRDSDHRVATVKVGSGFALVAPDSYTVDPGNLRDYEALARALQESDQRPQRVLHLWAMAPRGTGCGGDSDEDCEPDVHYRDGLALDYFSLLHLTRTFAAATSELRVYCVSTQVQAVAPGDEVHPRKAVLLGPCLVSPREYPGVSCTSIDIDWPVTASQRRRLLDHLARELRHVGTECEIALRGRDRWIRRYAPARLPAATPQQWVRAGGTYVIVGDLGGFAFPLAEHLATNGPVKLALIVPTRAPGHASDSDVIGDESTPGLQPAATLRRLRALGAEMLTLEADLADRDSGRRALIEVTQRLGAIDGLFHVHKGLESADERGG